MSLRTAFLIGGIFYVIGEVIATPATAQDDLKIRPPQAIDLPTALQLAGANNLDLAIVREALVQAKAANDAAMLRFLPWLSAGTVYSHRKGALQDTAGVVQDVDRDLRARTGAVALEVDLGNALFEKLAASQTQTAADFGVDAKHNDILLAAATAYFFLVGAAADAANASEAVRISSDYEQQLERAVAIGLTNRSDVLRVSVQTQRYEIALRDATVATHSASARLAQTLHLDPATELMPADAVAPQATLIPLDTELSSLVNDALTSRPELHGSQATVSAADWQRQNAWYGPLIPSVTAEALYGRLRGGPEGGPTVSNGFQDYALLLNWRLGPGGLLDFSRIDTANSRLRQARLNDARLRDQIIREVVEAYESARATSEQTALAGRSVELAQQSLQLSQDRRQFGVAAILEMIQAQKDLTDARADYIRTTTKYATTQYTLARAVARIGQ